jgi:hypothetical protein
MREYEFLRKRLGLALIVLLSSIEGVSQVPQSLAPTTTETGYEDLTLKGNSAEEPGDWPLEPLQLHVNGTYSQEASDTHWIAESDESRKGAKPTTTAAANDRKRLEITLTNAWASKYIFRGKQVLDPCGAYASAVDFRLWDSGLHLRVVGGFPSDDRSKALLEGEVSDWLWEALRNSVGRYTRSDLDQLLYSISWQGMIGNTIQVEFGGNYYDFFKISSGALDHMETYGVLTLPDCPLSPHFGAYYGWPYGGGSRGEGWMTDIGVSHMVPLENISFCGKTPVGLILTANLWYNGGEWSVQKAPGWAYATFTGKMPVPISEQLTVIPAVSYQVSIDDSVNEDDELYAAIALQYSW